jgi:hypothetical protein
LKKAEIVETKLPAELMEDFFEMLSGQELGVGQHLERFRIPYWLILLCQSHEVRGMQKPTRKEIRETVVDCVRMSDGAVCANTLSILRAKKRAPYCQFLSEMFCVFLFKKGIISKVILIQHPKQNHYGIEVTESGEVLQVWPEWERKVTGKATIDI